MERGLFNELSQFGLTYQEDDDIWFVGEKYSLVFHACISDCTIKKIIRMEDSELLHSRQYWRLVKVQNKIVILPCAYNKIVIFNTENNKFSTIYLHENISSCMSYIEERERLYLIDNSEIIVLDVKHEKVDEYISIPYQDNILITMALKTDGHILMPLICKNEVLDFHISDKQFTRLYLDCDANGFIAGILDGTDVWLAGCNGNIVKWNYISQKCTLYNKFPESFESFDYDEEGNFIPWKKGWTQGGCFKYWYDCFLIDDKIWFLPFLSRSLLYLDKKTNEICEYPFENEDETEYTMKKHRFPKFLFIGIQKERFIKIYSVKRDIIYSIDIVTLNYTEEMFNIDEVDEAGIEEEYRNILYNKASTEGILENKNISIKEFINIVEQNTTNTNTDIATLDGQVGAHVYRCLDFE